MHQEKKPQHAVAAWGRQIKKNEAVRITWGGSPGQSIPGGSWDTVPWDNSTAGANSRHLQRLHLAAFHWHTKGDRQGNVKSKLVCNTITTLTFCFFVLVTCLDFGGGDGTLDVSKDGVDGDGVLRGWVEALDHVEVKVVSEVYVLYVAVWKTNSLLSHFLGLFHKPRLLFFATPLYSIM